MPIYELLKVFPAPLTVNPTEKTLRHTRRLDNRKTLKHGWFMRHKLPEQVPAL
jgi:hypothetical protein